MEKRIKLPIIIVSAVLAALIIAVVVLCVIPVTPFKPFVDYDDVQIITTTNSNVGDITADVNDKSQKEFDKALKDTNYSVMHSLLEFSFNYSPRFVYKTEKNSKDKDVISKDSNGDKIKKEMTIAEVETDCIPSESAVVLVIKYSALKTLKVEKSNIEFNTLRVAVSTTDGQIKPITLYLYNKNMINLEGNPDSQSYRINPITIKANTSPLYISLKQIIDTLTK